MSRYKISTESSAGKALDGIYSVMERRIKSAPAGNCPLEIMSAYIRLCLAQSCGKCVPCRIGLDRLSGIIDKILSGDGKIKDLDLIKSTAETIYNTADCAIGYETAAYVLENLAAFRDDFISHIETGRCTENFKSVPCVSACPAHVDIPGYISLVKEKRYADAVRLIRKDNPFPSACALICEHPCERHCRRGIVDSPVNIRGIKLMAVENAGTVPAPKCAPSTGKTVAVVGGGPSGLTAAYYLSLMGHKVTVFEKRQRLGGMLRYGIPCYRLPDEYLDRDIDCILSTGIDVRYGVCIGKDITVEKLRGEFDSVYVSIGAHGGSTLGIEGEDLEGVMSAVKLLGDVGDNEKPDFTGKKVAVVGGGNVAMDAVRTSVRLGAESVCCVYRRRRADMTALPDEVAGAEAEGCEIMELMAPVKITGQDGRVTGLAVKPQIIGEVTKGRPAPYAADLPEKVIRCDIVIAAIGQKIESEDFERENIPVNRGKIAAGKDTSVTGTGGVFAGGDAVSGPATVILAIEAGKTAAANIDEYLGCHTEITADVEIPGAPWQYKPACGRIELEERPAAERKNDFDLMEKCMTGKEAEQECSRCLRCDHYGHAGFAGGRCTGW